jgi:hypothetical protein
VHEVDSGLPAENFNDNEPGAPERREGDKSRLLGLNTFRIYANVTPFQIREASEYRSDWSGSGLLLHMVYALLSDWINCACVLRPAWAPYSLN